jgi:hypothetical protein
MSRSERRRAAPGRQGIFTTFARTKARAAIERAKAVGPPVPGTKKKGRVTSAAVPFATLLQRMGEEREIT